MIKFFVIIIMLSFMSTTVSANEYNINDFFYRDKDRIVVVEPQARLYLFDKNYYLQNIINNDDFGLINNIQEYSLHGVRNGYIIHLNNINDTLKLLNKYDFLYPIVRLGTDEYMVYNSVQFSTIFSVTTDDLLKHFDQNYHGLNSASSNMTLVKGSLDRSLNQSYTLNLDRFLVCRNPFFLSNKMQNDPVFLSAVPVMQHLSYLSTKMWLSQHGAGTLGEKRTLNVEIKLPQSYSLNISAIPKLSSDNVLKQYADSLEAVGAQLIHSDDPVIHKMNKGNSTIYNITYDFMVYDIGNFNIGYMLFEAVDAHGATTILSPMIGYGSAVSFNVISVLNPFINDLQYIPTDYECSIQNTHENYTNYSAYCLTALLFIMLLIVLCISYRYLCRSTIVNIPYPAVSFVQNVIDGGFTDNNWRDKYHDLFRELSQYDDIDNDIMEELEKTYNLHALPDFDRLIKLLNYLEGQ